MTTCPICIENITQSKKFTCTFCNYVTCTKCVQTYLTSTPDDANCMNCKRLWNREILSLLPKSFINKDYKKHRENTLLERETAMMPSTQAYVEQEIQRRKNIKLLESLNKERIQLKRKLNELNSTCIQVQRNLNPPLENERRTFIQKCANETCRGFLSTQYKCNICTMYTCPDCNKIRGPARDSPHTCDENEKLSMQMIRRDSKKCPGCSQYIFKIDGCDQMWCIECHTAFSWRTGQIINGSIHNPHFYEFQRNRGNIQREQGDIPCGGLPNYSIVSAKLKHYDRSDHHLIFIFNIHRLTIHIEHIELPRYRYAMNATSNIDLRVQYMLNELNTDSFKSKIQQREKAIHKKRDISMILTMFITTISDWFRDIIYQQKILYYSEIKQLINYTNQNLLKIAKRYDCVIPIIDKDIRIKNVSHKFNLVLLDE